MSQLVITRRPGEGFRMTLEDGRVIHVKMFALVGNKMRIGIEAPRTITVDREEIAERKDMESDK